MRFQAQAAGETWHPLWDDEATRQLELLNSWTLLKVPGEVVGCGGTMEHWPGRHNAWFVPTSLAPHCMLRITRLVDKFTGPVKGRIEVTVRADFAAGHRWAKMLGFEVENAPGLLMGYGPMGEDHIAYVRFQ